MASGFKVPSVVPLHKKRHSTGPVTEKELTSSHSSTTTTEDREEGKEEEMVVEAMEEGEREENGLQGGEGKGQGEGGEERDREGEKEEGEGTNEEESGGRRTSTPPEHAPTLPKEPPQKKVVEPSAPPPKLPYTEPHWSGVPTAPFSLTVIKNGSVIQEIDISKKPFQVFGRLPTCDVSLDHPSISRYHAILQYRPQDEARGDEGEGEGEGERRENILLSTSPSEAGFYVYDLNSTHGTYLNKNKVQPRSYYRVRVGQMVRFGGSSRLFVLELSSSQDVVEAEAEAEIRLFQHQKEEKERLERKLVEERERLAREREEMGATWGMVMDEVQRREQEEEGEEVNLDPEREAYYKDDPKKALKKFFDREGLELDYEVEEEGPLHARVYTVRVRLPIEVASGEEMVVEETVKGKKKEAVVKCALKACRVLDSHDMLRRASQGHQRKIKNWEENDYYDSDEDSFLDRTGELERKRKQRMRRLGKLEEKAESYQTLQTRLEEVCQERDSVKARLAHGQHAQSSATETDSLDQYMSTVSSQLDPVKRTELRHQLQELRKEEEKIKRLLKIAKPTELPSIQKSTLGPAKLSSAAKTRAVKPTGKGTGPQLATPDSGSPTHLSPQMSGAASSEHVLSDERPKKDSGGGSEGVMEGGDGGRSGGGSGDGVLGGGGEKAVSAKTPPIKKPRLMGPSLPPRRKRDELESKREGTQWEEDLDYASWLPPENQSGDGRTYLNEKYGY